MNKATWVIAAGMGSALAMAGAVQAVAVADEAQGNAVQPVAIEASVDAREIAGDRVVVPEVVGTFGFTQTEVSSNEWIARHIGEASRYLCGSAVVQVEDGVDAADWVLEVTGDVAHPYATTIADLAATNEVQASLLGCACAANPTDGLAIANAMVEGISVNDILRIARPADGANTVVFVSADGYEVALPLAYLSGRACPLVFNINGSALVESVGGTNQLWLGSTPASYFARDVVSIRIETRDAVPADPRSDEARSAYEALPNIGVKFGGEIGA